MINTSPTPQAVKLAVREQNAEVEIGSEAEPSSRVIFPPVPQLLRGQRIPSRTEQVKKAANPYLHDEAVEVELTRLLKRYNEFCNSETYLARVANLALLCGQVDRAYEFANDAVRLNAGSEFRYRFAEIAFYRGEVETARTIWAELSAAGHLVASLRMAELSISESNYDQARGWLTCAMRIDETDWRVLAFAGTLALVVGEHDVAIRHFRVAREGRPNSVRLYYNLALAHVLSGHPKNAIKALRIAVGLSPFGQKALVAWADLSAHQGEGVREASQALSRYVGLYSEDKLAIDRLAYLHYLQGDDKIARDVLAQAREHFDDPAIVPLAHQTVGGSDRFCRRVLFEIGQHRAQHIVFAEQTDRDGKLDRCSDTGEGVCSSRAGG